MIPPVFRISPGNFEQAALDQFRHQAKNVPAYRDYLRLLGKDPRSVRRISQIPFLPAAAFRSRKVLEKGKKEERIFLSSGSTSAKVAKHHVAGLGIYRASLIRCFELFYGSPRNFAILALLPSCLERKDSSLVYMAGELIKLSGHPRSGFYLNDTDALAGTIRELEVRKQKSLLLGVSFALMDFAEKHELQLEHTIVMETGGMKGKRKEITRSELHAFLTERFHVPSIHSEYGMTELLSQAYSTGSGIFRCPPWMRIFIRDPYDPFGYVKSGKQGGLNIIDLANMHSCCFVETMDLGRSLPGNAFEVTGRYDAAAVRGCNLLV